MALALEIEYLAGVCFAAVGPDSEAADWPPQPDRVFSALVATWGAHGEPPDERSALEWLEGLDPPRSLASTAYQRTTPAVYVPPNDYVTPNGELRSLKWYRDFVSRGVEPTKAGGHKDAWKRVWSVMPDERKRSGLKERRFPAVRPRDSVVQLQWSVEPDALTLAALVSLAGDTSYVGHSASLTRCRFTLIDAVVPESLAETKRTIYPGRLDELRAAYARIHKSGDRKDRPSPGAPVLPGPTAQAARRNVFAARWLVLEHLGGTMPDLRAAALVARGIRKALMSGYGRLGEAVPGSISGHEPDGSPAVAPHLAIVPLAFAGFPHADGRVLGFALVPPVAHDLLRDERFLDVLRALAARDGRYGRRVVEVKSSAGSAPGSAFALTLSPTFEPAAGRRSLDPAPYAARARTFATVTPIVLDRHLKRQGAARDEEVAEQIATACGRIGLPAPQVVAADKHSAVQGAPSAWPSGKGPAWLGWRLPGSLAGRQLTHAVIRFAEPVEGPVLLGAGRFHGLGLCLPLDREPA